MSNPESANVYRKDYQIDSKLKKLIEADRKIIEKYENKDGNLQDNSYLDYLANSDYKGADKRIMPVL
jgi:hypothetical protein